MALINKHKRIVRQVFKQRRRWFTWCTASQISGVVLNARTGTSRLHHLQIKRTALIQPLRFQQAAMVIQLLKALLEFCLDRLGGLVQRRLWRHIVRVRVDLHQLKLTGLLTCQRIKLGDAFNLIAPKGNTPRPVLIVRREHFNRITPHAERPTLESCIIALILQRNQIGEQLALLNLLTNLQLEGHGRIGLNRSNTVDTGDRRHDDHIITFQQRAGCRVAHPVNLLVDRAFFLNKRIRPCHIGFGLIVVIVRDEILDRIVREEAFELPIELRRQRLVGRKDQCRTLCLRNQLRHGEGLTRTRNTQQNLRIIAILKTGFQIRNRCRLVPFGLKFGFQNNRNPTLGL